MSSQGPDAAPSVSVVVPCRDAAPYLEQCLRSAVEQQRPPLEVVVVDDGSADGSLDIALGMQTEFPGLLRVFRRRSGSATRTRNLGAAAARGSALLFLDADDVIGPGVIDALATALGTAAAVAMCPWYRLEQVGDQWLQRPPSHRPRRSGEDPLAAWLTGWWNPPCSVLWSRAAFEYAGRWDPLCTVDDDGDIMMRALASGVPLVEAGRGRAFYRRPPSGVETLSGRRFGEEGLRSRLRVIDKVIAALEEHDRVDDYRVELRVRLAAVAADAGTEHPNVARDAQDRRRALGDPWTRQRSAFHAAKRGIEARARRAARRLPVGTAPPDQQRELAIDFGARTDDDRPAASASGGRPARLDVPAVSVVLPTYQRASALRSAMASVLSQDFTDLELVVVDDASTDDTQAVVEGFHDDRIRYLRQPTNLGVSAARNRALRASRGDLVAFIDSDDEWLPGKLRKQVDRMAELPAQVGLLYGGTENVEPDGSCRIVLPQQRGDLRFALARRNVVHGTSGVLMRRAVVSAIGFFDERVPAAEDWDYWLRAAQFFQFDHLDEPLVRYSNDASDALRKTLATADNQRARQRLYEKHRSRMRHAGVDHLFLVDTARRLRRAGEHEAAQRAALRALRSAPFSLAVHRTLLRSVADTRRRR
jgi:glycosyltransferase involved in cell wall biosynthesis